MTSVLCLTKGSLDDHLKKVELVLQRQQREGLLTKSFFTRSQLEHLGCWITFVQIKPVCKKVIAVMKFAEPKNRRELQSFIGVVNYYQDVWTRCSHVLAPLASIMSKNNQVEMRASTQEGVCYKPFQVHTDATRLKSGLSARLMRQSSLSRNR